VAAEAAGPAAAAGDADKGIEENMTSRRLRFDRPNPLTLLALGACLCLLPVTAKAQADTAHQPTAQGPKAFATPQQAEEEFIQAATVYDVPKLLAMFGPDGKDLIDSVDPIRDKNNALAFAEKAKVSHTVKQDPSKPNLATIIVGQDEWPLPVPLVKKNGKWYFDTKSGRQEILFRRIGANELDAIQVCRGFVEAQIEYASQIHDDSGINQYAQKILSSPGKQDGLYWQNSDGSSAGPIGEAVAKALAEGYSYSGGRPGFHGYYFKILKGQGRGAPMGRLDYVIEGVMIGGFALVAVPAEYGVTGVKTFIVNNDGIVYQKDLGSDSLNIVKSMELYNPDSSWHRTNDEWPQDIASANP
jgi:hypothetical protein